MQKKLQFGPLFGDQEKAVALTNAEVFSILLSKKNELEAEDKIPSEILRNTITHAQKMAQSMDVAKVRETRSILAEKEAMNKRKLHSFEIAALVNLASYEDVENATILIPSLLDFSNEVLTEIIEEVNRLAEI